MFDHVQIKVSDFEISRDFYTKVLETLGHEIVLEFENVIGIGSNPHDMFEIAQANGDKGLPLSSSVHIAFVANSEDEVRNFHEVALKNGAKDNGIAGLRDYEDGYFSAFIIDNDGHNIEVVFKKKK